MPPRIACLPAELRRLGPDELAFRLARRRLMRRAYAGDEEVLADLRDHEAHPVTNLMLKGRWLIKDGVLVGARPRG